MPGVSAGVRQLGVGDRPMAVTLVFDGNIGTTLVSQHTNTHCVSVEIKTEEVNFMLVNQYFQFADEIQRHLEFTRRVLDDYTTGGVIIMADMNAKSVLWHCDHTDERSEQVELLVAGKSLVVVNRANNPPTYRGRAGAKTNIDVTLANEYMGALIRDWKVEDMLTSSDHNVIRLSVEKQVTDNRTVGMGSNTSKYNLRRANWQRLKIKFEEQPPIQLSHPDEMASDLVI